ncbi:MAG: hypothetical protein Q9M18_08320 [Mariprofundaceae bacterium]|nr:hypothetical protein [Mariprofundaceae bacterium]
MQINPTGQITSEAQVQAIVSGSQTPMQVTADTQASASTESVTQVASSDRVTISQQAQALARSEVSESPASESIESASFKSLEGKASAVGKTA